MTGVSSPDGSRGIRGVAPNGSALLYGVISLLVFAALFLGTWRPLPQLILELAALAILCYLLWSGSAPVGVTRETAAAGSGTGALSRSVLIFLGLLFLLPLTQLLPLPAGLWAELPGRAFYATAMRLAGDGDGAGFDWRAISIIPSTTEAAWLALLPPLAVFLSAVRLDRERLMKVVVVFLGMAAAEALMGLIQFGQAGDYAYGTYRNHNHLAGLLEMALPVGLALLAATLGQARPAHARQKKTTR